jgi:DNA-3-methyladenine glycosylase II
VEDTNGGIGGRGEISSATSPGFKAFSALSAAFLASDTLLHMADGNLHLDEGTLARARRTLARRDPVLGCFMQRVGRCGIEVRGDPYRQLVRSVIYQQLAGSAARAIDGRVRGLFRGRYPRPDRWRDTTDAQLRGAGLSRQKIAAVRAVADAFATGTLDNRRLRRMDDDAVIEAVTRVRGIGTWTAHMLLMFSLGRADVLPVGDFGVRKGARVLYELAEMPKPAELEMLAAPWRPYRSVASWYLWRAADTLTPGVGS